MQPTDSPLELITWLPKLAPRPPDSNKGSFGKILVVAGSRGMSGAAVLCGSAALRGGAGLVKVAVPHEILPIVAAANPCYLTHPLAQDPQGALSLDAEEPLLRLFAANDVVAIGPGIGRSADLDTLIPSLLSQSRLPIVLDADGLNAFVGQPEKLRREAAPLIITPHPGEFARLVGVDIPAVQAQRQELAAQFAREHAVIVVLKGYGTIVTDGKRVYQNTTGNPGLATGGTGDVLTGLIAALVGQGLEPFAAAQLGVYLHGLAGDLARGQLGEISIIASDLLQYLPVAFQRM